VEQARSASLRLDRVAPATTASQAPAGDGVQVTLTAADATSGVAGSEVKVDDGSWAAYTAPVRITAPGTHVVSYRATDRAGLVEATKTLTVTVADRDTTGPTLVVTGLADGADYGHSREPVLGWSATPTGHPVRSVTARLDGGAVTAGRLDLSALSLGRHTLVVTATDSAGNVTTRTLRFTVSTSFTDVKRLVKRFAKDGSMTKAVRAEVLDGLVRAQTLAKKTPARSVEVLREVLRDLGDVRDDEHRQILRKDVRALIRELT
jgi:hypothetical protein